MHNHFIISLAIGYMQYYISVSQWPFLKAMSNRYYETSIIPYVSFLLELLFMCSVLFTL